MAIKMRVLYDSKKKGMAQFANVIKTKYELPINATSGKFPPEYPCDKERIVILGLTAKGELSDDVRRFCMELNKKNANNVALLVDGDEKMGNALVEILKSVGTNVMDNVLYVKVGGGLPFLGGKVTDDEKKALLDWAHSIVDNLQ